MYETVAGVAFSTAAVEAGVNTRTVEYNNFTPQHGTKYYFWIKVMSPAYGISDSAWSNVAEFTYP